ncbi:hypothetical protein QTG56_25945 (plasmid) [Rossellomorea sp. AcN35-11]|nr:hypothetical protein [Rossellomorea aquimaris]WJV32060.1 hypothetical protein QTG56_25945 [Rossellomorea sp. AcN35-11]
MIFEENRNMELLIEAITNNKYSRFKEGFFKVTQKADISFNVKAEGIECKVDGSLNLIPIDTIKSWKKIGPIIILELLWGDKLAFSR